jgi:hypothetical protein
MFNLQTYVAPIIIGVGHEAEFEVAREGRGKDNLSCFCRHINGIDYYTVFVKQFKGEVILKGWHGQDVIILSDVPWTRRCESRP